ncbi:hypothetical protein MMC25_001088 [Agyrium rufum]|nr:hypothetical protein [Agyrium rufum]
MDPCSVIGVVSSGLQIVATITSTIKGLSDLKVKYSEADQSIRLLIRELSTIKAGIGIIHDWAENDLVMSPDQPALVEALEVAIDGCREAMDALSEEVAQLVGSVAAESIGFRTRTRFIWNETSMREHQARLNSQVSALDFLVTAVKCRSPQERRVLITENQSIIQQVLDDTSTLRASRNGSLAYSQATPTIISHSDSTIDERALVVDHILVESQAYDRVRAYRRDVARHRTISETMPSPKVDEEPDDFDGRSTTGTERSYEPLSPRLQVPNPMQRRRQSYEPSVNSEPADVYKSRNLGAAHRTVSSEPVYNNGSTVSMSNKSKMVLRKTWLPFRRKDRATSMILSQDPNSLAPPTESRRGRRSNADLNQSIDFSSADSLNVPALIRAAQAGSTVEVERILDRGTNIEARHASTGRNALAVAAHCGNDEVVDVLLRYGAKSNQRDASMSTPLHLAASRGHREAIRILLQDGAEVELRDTEDRTPLWLACEHGHLETAQLLISYRARVNTRDKNQLTSLHCAAKQGDADMVNLLITNGAHVDAKDANLMAAMHYACEGGHENAVRILMSKHADLEAKGKGSHTPFTLAAAAGQLQILELLLKRKASTKTRADKGMTAMHFASQNGHVEVVDYLSSKRVPVNVQDAGGKTPLHLAIIRTRFDVVELLLRKKAELELRCQASFTALHYACAAGDIRITELLLGSGSHPEATTSDDGRPLHVAVSHGSLPLVRLLLERGVDYEARDRAEERAISLAAFYGHVSIVEMLLDYGSAERSRFSSKPKSHEDSPLCVAARQGHLNVCSLLISRGASVRQKDELLWSPLRYAAHYGHPEIVSLLLSYGAEVTSVGPSGGWGFEVTASRIGFAQNVDIPESRKQQVLQLLVAAERDERLLKDKEQQGVSAAPLSVNHLPSELSSNWTPDPLLSRNINPVRTELPHNPLKGVSASGPILAVQPPQAQRPLDAPSQPQQAHQSSRDETQNYPKEDRPSDSTFPSTYHETITPPLPSPTMRFESAKVPAPVTPVYTPASPTRPAPMTPMAPALKLTAIGPSTVVVPAPPTTMNGQPIYEMGTDLPEHDVLHHKSQLQQDPQREKDQEAFRLFHEAEQKRNHEAFRLYHQAEQERKEKFEASQKLNAIPPLGPHGPERSVDSDEGASNVQAEDTPSLDSWPPPPRSPPVQIAGSPPPPSRTPPTYQGSQPSQLSHWDERPSPIRESFDTPRLSIVSSPEIAQSSDPDSPPPQLPMFSFGDKLRADVPESPQSGRSDWSFQKGHDESTTFRVGRW